MGTCAPTFPKTESEADLKRFQGDNEAKHISPRCKKTPSKTLSEIWAEDVDDIVKTGKCAKQSKRGFLVVGQARTTALGQTHPPRERNRPCSENDDPLELP